MSQQSTRWEQAATKYEQCYDPQRYQQAHRAKAGTSDSVHDRVTVERALDAAAVSLRDFFDSDEGTAAKLLLAASMEIAVLGRAEMSSTFLVLYGVSERGLIQVIELAHARRSDQVHFSRQMTIQAGEFVRALRFECHIDPGTVMTRLRAELDRIANLAPDLV